MTAALRFTPVEERPRERLLRDGEKALAIPELIAIILGSGTKGKSVLTLSQELFSHFGSLHHLVGASVAELMEVKGIGRAKAIQLKAVFAIAERCRKPLNLERFHLQSPDDVFSLAQEEIGREKQEVLLIVLRDVKGYFLHKERIAVGTLTEVLVHPREVFYPAIRFKAHSFFLVHNHPSGDLTPSDADKKLTRFLIESSKYLGIPLLDHLIVTGHDYLSFRKLGYFGDSPSHGFAV